MPYDRGNDPWSRRTTTSEDFMVPSTPSKFRWVQGFFFIPKVHFTGLVMYQLSTEKYQNKGTIGESLLTGSGMSIMWLKKLPINNHQYNNYIIIIIINNKSSISNTGHADHSVHNKSYVAHSYSSTWSILLQVQRLKNSCQGNDFYSVFLKNEVTLFYMSILIFLFLSVCLINQFTAQPNVCGWFYSFYF